MVTTLIQPDTNYANQTILPQGTTYKYDQLNRLMEMKAFINITNNAFGTTTYNGRYNNRFTYDANGNILSQVRKKQDGTMFDSLRYRYVFDSQGRKTQNRLYHVNDTIAASVMNDDVDNQGNFSSNISTINVLNNYRYDKIGNLVRDSAEGIATIDWTVYGKIKSVTHRTGFYRMNGTDTVRPPDLVFNYDAAGDRISKIAKPRTATGTKTSNYWTTQLYVRDAQGNTMSVYNQHDSVAISAAYFTQVEKHMYGSSRIGIENTNTELLGATFSTDTSNHFAGNKSFELSNHLGNVLATISDKKIPVDTNANDTIDFYVADIRSATDYAPFGAPLDGRTWNASSYRMAFNGKENDLEAVGTAGGTQDYGMRIYNPTLGRFLSVDPLFRKYPELTPYQFASNTPLQATDLDGEEAKYSTTQEKGGKTTINITIDVSVKNTANFSKEQLNNYLAESKSQIESIYSGTDGKTTYKTTVNFLVDEKNDKVQKTDFYVELRKGGAEPAQKSTDSRDVEGRTQDVGNTNKNRFQINTDGYDPNNKMDVQEMANTTAHEIGHGMGLTHESAKGDGGNVVAPGGWYGSLQTKVNQEQFQSIPKTIDKNAGKVPSAGGHIPEK